MSKKQMNKTREQLVSKLAELMGSGPRLDEYLGDWSNDPMDQVQSGPRPCGAVPRRCAARSWGT